MFFFKKKAFLTAWMRKAFYFVNANAPHIPFRRKSNKIEIMLIIKPLLNVFSAICLFFKTIFAAKIVYFF